MQCPRCQHENRVTAKFCEECATPLKLFSGAGPSEASYEDLRQEVRLVTRALTESLEQQAATSEILRVISSWPTDTQPVFDAIVESAVRLCGARDVNIRRLEGDRLRLVAHYGPIPVPSSVIPVVHGTVAGRAVLERRAIHAVDLQAAADEFPEGATLAMESGYRTILSVPLIRDRAPLGMIQLRRAEANLFTDKQLALLQTFADQAVIAIENVRLFTELDKKNGALTEAHAQVTEALEQQTATADILRVISSSPDVQPVFDIIAAKALDLCRAKTGAVFRFDGERVHVVAAHSFSAEGAESLRQSYPLPLSRGGATVRAVLSSARLRGRRAEGRDRSQAPAREPDGESGQADDA